MKCRLCLMKVSELERICVLKDEDIAKKVVECVSIQIVAHDDLPSTICVSCLRRINDWFTFKHMCLSSNETLLKQRERKLAEENELKAGIKSNSDEVKANGFEIVPKELDIQHPCPRPDNKYTCEICFKDFKNFLEYLDHQPIHNGEPVFKCDKCEKIFITRNELVKHDQNHKISCPKCGKTVRQSSLKHHLVRHTDKYVCPHCSLHCSGRSVLQEHITVKHTDNRAYICEHCSKCFYTKTSLKVHSKTHSDEREFKCEVCPYKGKTHAALYIHMSAHANDQCICEYCSKLFKSYRNLNDHLRRVHSKEKKHQCEICSKRFVDKYMLTVHLRCHTGVRPYTCNVCDKAFVRSDSLKEHMRTHGQFTVCFACDKCERTFAAKRNLLRHHCIERNRNTEASK